MAQRTSPSPSNKPPPPTDAVSVYDSSNGDSSDPGEEQNVPRSSNKPPPPTDVLSVYDSSNGDSSDPGEGARDVPSIGPSRLEGRILKRSRSEGEDFQVCGTTGHPRMPTPVRR